MLFYFFVEKFDYPKTNLQSVFLIGDVFPDTKQADEVYLFMQP